LVPLVGLPQPDPSPTTVLLDQMAAFSEPHTSPAPRRPASNRPFLHDSMVSSKQARRGARPRPASMSNRHLPAPRDGLAMKCPGARRCDPSFLGWPSGRVALKRTDQTGVSLPSRSKKVTCTVLGPSVPGSTYPCRVRPPRSSACPAVRPRPPLLPRVPIRAIVNARV
jgi:hypothetical protein